MEISEIAQRRRELLSQISELDELLDLKKREDTLLNVSPNKLHRKVRTVARALLDLYELLGHQPAERNGLIRVAERDR
ncbi:MAG: hypothetical protein RJA36_592 [Pseudomonadota bacterium]|jgi:hypothetical protein